jgi:hypothetical protein
MFRPWNSTENFTEIWLVDSMILSTNQISESRFSVTFKEKYDLDVAIWQTIPDYLERLKQSQILSME